MGMDFVALIRYPGPLAVESAIRQLESDEPAEFRRLVELGLRPAFAFAEPHETERSNIRWVEIRNHNTISGRPPLPSVEHLLSFPSDFHLTFGSDVVLVYRTLRWLRFLTDPERQRAMLAAVRVLCLSLRGFDCVITSDFHPAYHAVLAGRPFAEALQAGTPEDGEVASIADLYLEWVPEDSADSIFKPIRNGQFRQVYWDREWPIPEGWQLVTTWDSKGYWRFDWRTWNESS